MTTTEGFYRSGDYYLACDECGFKKRASECRKRYDGAMVCASTCWEEEHPLDRIQVRTEQPRVLEARNPEPVFVGVNEVQPEDL